MWGKALVAITALVLASGPAAAVPGPVDPASGKINGFTYGESDSNSYTSWSGGMVWIWFFSSQHIGYQGAPVAGEPFYLHAHTGVIAPHSVTGHVLMTIDQDAGGVPLRYAPSADMPLQCALTQFDPVTATTPRPCRSTVSVESGQFVVSNLEPLVPGFGFEVLMPVVVAGPSSGNAAMTAMWASEDVTLNVNNVMASVPLTVGVNPNPSPVMKPLPKALRKYTKVKSLTPKVCTVKKHKVVVHKHGLCKLKGGKRIVKVRY